MVTPAGVFENTTAIFYTLETPVLCLVDIYDPECQGYLRLYNFGTVHWVTGLGPVHCRWRSGMSAGPNADTGRSEVVVTLTATPLLP